MDELGEGVRRAESQTRSTPGCEVGRPSPLRTVAAACEPRTIRSGPRAASRPPRWCPACGAQACSAFVFACVRDDPQVTERPRNPARRAIERRTRVRAAVRRDASYLDHQPVVETPGDGPAEDRDASQATGAVVDADRELPARGCVEMPVVCADIRARRAQCDGHDVEAFVDLQPKRWGMAHSGVGKEVENGDGSRHSRLMRTNLRGEVAAARLEKANVQGHAALGSPSSAIPAARMRRALRSAIFACSGVMRVSSRGCTRCPSSYPDIAVLIRSRSPRSR